MKTITMLRTVHHGEHYLVKGKTYSVEAELAERLVKEKKATAGK